MLLTDLLWQIPARSGACRPLSSICINDHSMTYGLNPACLACP